MADKYANWADLAKNEKAGETYDIEIVREKSSWSHIAYHGGNMELLTAELAKAVAAERRQNYYAVIGKKGGGAANDLHLTGVSFDEPQAVKLQGSVYASLAYHGLSKAQDGDHAETVYLGGAEAATGGYRTDIAANLKAKGFQVKQGAVEYKNDDPANIVNRTKWKKGTHVELPRALRDKMSASGNANDLSKGYTQLFHDFVDAITPVTGPADVYQSWADLKANEKEGTGYTVEVTDRTSGWAHIAIHGGKPELLTKELAKACADERGQKYYAFVGNLPKFNDRLRIPVTKYDEPQCVKLVASAESCIAYHAVSGDKAEVHIAGQDADAVADLTAALKEAGFTVGTSTKEAGAKDAANICNKTKSKKGVHVELTRALRDKMSASGNANDLSKGTTATFTTFVRAVSSVTGGSSDAYQSWAALTANETEGTDYKVELVRRGSAYSHLAIHGGKMENLATELARKAAEVAEQNYFSVIGLKPRYNDRLAIPSDKFDEPQCVKLQGDVDYTISYHAVTDREGDAASGVIRVGGLDTAHRDQIVKALKDAGLRVEVMKRRQGLSASTGGVHEGSAMHSNAANITNKNRLKKGVQIELNRTMRNKMSASGDAADLSKGTTATFDKFIAAVTSVTIDTDRHQSWTSFARNEKAGRDYQLDVVRNPESDVAHIAIHGGPMECITSALAEAAAKPKKANFYSMTSIRKKFSERLRIPSTMFAEPTLLDMQKGVQFSFSYHGHADKDGDPSGGVVHIGGLDYATRDEIAEELKSRGFNVKINSGIEWGGNPTAPTPDHSHANNVVQKNKQKMGVQFELNRTLRDRMSASGNACDLSKGTTKVFTDFIAAVRKVTNRFESPEQETGSQKCIRYTINRFHLDQPKYGFKLMKGTEYAPAVSPRLFHLPIPAWHGEMPMWHDPISNMKVTFEIQITGRTGSELRQRWDAFTALCGIGKYTYVTLSRYRGIYLRSDVEHDPHDRNKSLGEYAHARLESLSSPEFEPGMKRLRATAVFDVPAGVWRSHKIYYQYFKDGGNQRCVVAKVSTAPVYSIMIRVQVNPQVDTWALVDRLSQTGVAWGKPDGIKLKAGQYVYADTNLMRAYLSTKQDWPEDGESFGDFISRIKGTAVWSDFRYIRNGPLNLTSEVQYAENGDTGDLQLNHRSGLTVSVRKADGTALTNLEVGIMARAARF